MAPPNEPNRFLRKEEMRTRPPLPLDMPEQRTKQEVNVESTSDPAHRAKTKGWTLLRENIPIKGKRDIISRKKKKTE